MTDLQKCAAAKEKWKERVTQVRIAWYSPSARTAETQARAESIVRDIQDHYGVPNHIEHVVQNNPIGPGAAAAFAKAQAKAGAPAPALPVAKAAAAPPSARAAAPPVFPLKPGADVQVIGMQNKFPEINDKFGVIDRHR